MRIVVTGRHVEVTDDVREYVENKANKLLRFYDRIHEIEVVLDHESELFTAEMIVRAGKKHTFIASETGPDTFVIVDRIIDKLERQLTKHKEKTQEHRNNGKNQKSDDDEE